MVYFDMNSNSNVSIGRPCRKSYLRRRKKEERRKKALAKRGRKRERISCTVSCSVVACVVAHESSMDTHMYRVFSPPPLPLPRSLCSSPPLLPLSSSFHLLLSSPFLPFSSSFLLLLSYSINFYVPLTPIGGTSALYLESAPGKEDWHDIKGGYVNRLFRGVYRYLGERRLARHPGRVR